MKKGHNKVWKMSHRLRPALLEQIVKIAGSGNRNDSEIIGITGSGNWNNLLEQGRDMAYIADLV
jgi:hypothetical protein